VVDANHDPHKADHDGYFLPATTTLAGLTR